MQELSDLAKVFLIQAASTKRGDITVFAMPDLHVTVNGIEYGTSGEGLEQARIRQALTQLFENGLVDASGVSGGSIRIIHLTIAGYEKAARINQTLRTDSLSA